MQNPRDRRPALSEAEGSTMPCDSDVLKALRPTQTEALRESINLKHGYYSMGEMKGQYIYVDSTNISVD